MKTILKAFGFAALSAAAHAAPVEDAAALFNLNCAPCHSKDGKAQTPAARKLGVKDLSRSTLSDEEIQKQIRNGRKTPNDKQVMPSFQDRLTQDQIRVLIPYIKTFRK